MHVSHACSRPEVFGGPATQCALHNPAAVKLLGTCEGWTYQTQNVMSSPQDSWDKVASGCQELAPTQGSHITLVLKPKRMSASLGMSWKTYCGEPSLPSSVLDAVSLD